MTQMEPGSKDLRILRRPLRRRNNRRPRKASRTKRPLRGTSHLQAATDIHPHRATRRATRHPRGATRTRHPLVGTHTRHLLVGIHTRRPQAVTRTSHLRVGMGTHRRRAATRHPRGGHRSIRPTGTAGRTPRPRTVRNRLLRQGPFGTLERKKSGENGAARSSSGQRRWFSSSGSPAG